METNFTDKIEIRKLSDNHYTIKHLQAAVNGVRMNFQEIFVDGSDEYASFVSILEKKRPEDMVGLKTVPKGETPEESARNLENYVSGFIFEKVREGLLVEVSYEEIRVE